MRLDVANPLVCACLASFLAACAAGPDEPDLATAPADNASAEAGCAAEEWAGEVIEDRFTDPESLSMVADADGNLHVVYDLGLESFHRTRDAVQGTWSGRQPIGSRLGEADLAIDGAGGLHVAMCSAGTVSYLRGDAGGGSWSTFVVESPAQGDFCDFPAIGVGPDETVHLTWARKVEGNVLGLPEDRYRFQYAEGDPTGAFAIETVDERAERHTVGFPSDVVVDGAGGVHGLYLDEPVGSEALLWHAHRAPGEAFVKDVVADGFLVRIVAVAADPALFAHVYYYDLDTPGLVHRQLDGCSVHDVVSDELVVSDIAAAVDAAGGSHVVYRQDLDPNGALKRLSYGYRPAGGRFSTRVLAEGNNLDGIQLAVAPDGRPHVMYSDPINRLQYLRCGSP